MATRGRPLDPAADAAIVRAAAALLAREGFQRMTVPAVAEAAGVAKTTVYRRYRTTAELALAAIEHLNLTHPAPSTGSARGDLTLLLEQVRQRYDLSITGTLLVEEREHPELFAAARHRMFSPAVERFRAAIRAGVASGELAAELDVDAAAHALLGSFFAHYFDRGRPERGWAESVIAALWPALTDRSGE